MAKLYFRYGAMSSGKSSALIGIAKNYDVQGKKTLILKPGIDDRDGVGVVASRNGFKMNSRMIGDETDMVSEVVAKRPDCVLVDEAQFLNKVQVMQLVRIVDELDVPVIAFGLKNDFCNNLFEGSMYLLIYADKIEEIKTICWFCNSKATMNLRVHDGKPIYDGDQIQIGGSESYLPVCRRCYANPPL